jgi:agmatinase
MNDEILAWLKENDIRVHYQAEIEKDGWETVMNRVLEEVKDIENLVVTIDVDVMNQVYVPGTGGREPDGPSSEEVMRLMRALGIQNNVVLVEISEYNPMLDSRNNQTATVVRKLMEHYLYGLAARKRGIKDPFYYHPDMIYDGR